MRGRYGGDFAFRGHMQEQAKFEAAIAQIQSGIRIGPDGMRLQLDVPETELPQALRLLQWRDRVLKVTVEPETRHTETNVWPRPS